jgi:hypothetical protein
MTEYSESDELLHTLQYSTELQAATMANSLYVTDAHASASTSPPDNGLGSSTHPYEVIYTSAEQASAQPLMDPDMLDYHGQAYPEGFAFSEDNFY